MPNGGWIWISPSYSTLTIIPSWVSPLFVRIRTGFSKKFGWIEKCRASSDCSHSFHASSKTCSCRAFHSSVCIFLFCSIFIQFKTNRNTTHFASISSPYYSNWKISAGEKNKNTCFGADSSKHHQRHCKHAKTAFILQ